jgi:hypothetical protein
MTRSLPRWVHRNLPRAAPPDSWRSLRSARVPPVHYLDKLPRPSLGATSLNSGGQFSMSKRVQFRTSVDNRAGDMMHYLAILLERQTFLSRVG